MREHLEALEKARDFMLTKIDAGTTRYINHNTVRRLEGVMNSADKPHWDADSSVSSVLRRSPVFRISKSFLSKFITPSRHNYPGPHGRGGHERGGGIGVKG